MTVHLGILLCASLFSLASIKHVRSLPTNMPDLVSHLQTTRLPDSTIDRRPPLEAAGNTQKGESLGSIQEETPRGNAQQGSSGSSRVNMQQENARGNINTQQENARGSKQEETPRGEASGEELDAVEVQLLREELNSVEQTDEQAASDTMKHILDSLARSTEHPTRMFIS